MLATVKTITKAAGLMEATVAQAKIKAVRIAWLPHATAMKLELAIVHKVSEILA